MINIDAIKFNIGHFPRGTIVAADVMGKKYEVEVDHLVHNAPTSWVIVTNQPDPVIEGIQLSFHISRATKITKRGTGPLVVDPGYATRLFYHNHGYRTECMLFKKAKSEYLVTSGDIIGLIQHIAGSDHDHDHTYDDERITNALHAQGVLCRVGGVYFPIYTANKRRLIRTLKQLMAKYKISRAQQQRAYDQMWVELYEREHQREMEREREIDWEVEQKMEWAREIPKL